MQLSNSWTMSRFLLAMSLIAIIAACSSPTASPSASDKAAPAAVSQEKGGQEEFGPYELVENWPQPLEDGPDGVKHEGWTWGSVGAVFAETPDRIWIAQRGELPLPAGAKPWTPYGALTPPAMMTDIALPASRNRSEGGNGVIITSSSWSIATASWSSRGRTMTSCSK